MLGSLILVGWMAYKEAGWLIGGMLVLAFCMLPGVITSSMGILSENLYLLLSLAALLTYSSIKKDENAGWGWYLLLLGFLTFAILTRTIGIALIAAVSLITMLEKELGRSQKIRVYLIVISGAIFWQLWGVFNPQTSDMTYGYYIEHYIGSEASAYSVLEFIWNSFKINSMQILSAWSHYLALNHTNFWLFLFSYTLLILCLTGLVLRLLQRKLDALYVTLYIFILLIWPHPGEMTRFLHPIVFLLFIQPVFYCTGNANFRSQLIVKMTLVVFILALIVNSFVIQTRMLAQRGATQSANLDLSHAYELYDFPSRDAGLYQATSFAMTKKYMKMSAQYVPPEGVVATVKHVNYSILTDKRAVNHVGVVSDLQQLCNLKIKGVDLIFLSDLTTGFNQEGYTQWEKYRDISSDIWKAPVMNNESVAYSIAIDKSKLNSKLEKAGYNCQAYQAHR